MGSEEFALTWDDHHSTLVAVFEKLLETRTLVDCTIAAEGQYLKAHKVVLSACSPYFELLFGQEHEKNPIVVLKDIKFRELKAIIDFIYRGNVKIPEDQLADFVDAAESLQVKGLGGEHKRHDSVKRTNNFPCVRKRGLSSPVSSKRTRNDCFSAGEIDLGSLSSETKVSEQASRCENLPSQQLLGNTSTSSTTSVNILSSDSGTNSSVTFAPIIQSEQSSRDPNVLSSSVQPTLPPTETERVLRGATSVVKDEPDPVCEVFLPEPECMIEPKKEECMEEVTLLENDEVTGEEMPQSTNQYSDFSLLHGSLEEETDNSFLATQMAENISIQGGGLLSKG